MARPVSPQSPEVRHNPDMQRFELQQGDALALLEYTRSGNLLSLNHTFVPDSLRGQGIASRLLRGALDQIREMRCHITPRCWFVSEFLKKHSDYADLLEKP